MPRIKIGRNDNCLCGSGRKYKHCCLQRLQGKRPPDVSKSRVKVSLRTEVEKIVTAAKDRRSALSELGVFILHADHAGDAWLFEVTQKDAVQLARAGEPLVVSIEENPETIMVDWSHHYSFQEGRLLLTAYKGGEQHSLGQGPSELLLPPMQRIESRCTPELLKRIHVEGP